MRCREGYLLGPLAFGVGRAAPGGDVVERCQTWANGLLHSGFAVRLTPWRRSKHESRYLLAGPFLFVAWRL